jgi:4-alpha-glucanotransferase
MTGAHGGRASGILLHPTSLPGPHGIGDLGEAALRFLDFLAEARQTLWQVLPLGPTGYGDSPYACFSSFAGNPLLVSLDALARRGLLSPAELQPPAPFTESRVDYGRVMQWKLPLLRAAARRFLSAGGSPELAAFRAEESWWLADWSLFRALKDHRDAAAREEGRAAGGWNRSWGAGEALRDPAVLAAWRDRLSGEVAVNEALQFHFFSQWGEVRAAAAERGVRIIGDLPIFVAEDSADVWANRENFLLDGAGRPTAVSGVPPDYFSATGQLWGNPLYDWDALASRGFRFWVDRLRAARRLFDFIRVDHFRGFHAAWSVPAGKPTAEEGRWAESPGEALFAAVEREMGRLPIIAEDLGVITAAVTALREKLGFPGMRILQFAFDSAEAGGLGPENRFLPHNHAADSVVYTGTHDNDTTAGWYAGRTPEERAYIDRYAPGEPDVSRRFIRMALASVCRFAVVPLQDVLGLGSEARMNTPGTASGNWAWRFTGALGSQTAAWLRGLSELYGR